MGDSAVRVWLPFLLVSRKTYSVAAGQKSEESFPPLFARPPSLLGNIVLK